MKSLKILRMRLFCIIITIAGFSYYSSAQMPAAITIEPPYATAYDELTSRAGVLPDYHLLPCTLALHT
jgi:hypothetical protein